MSSVIPRVGHKGAEKESDELAVGLNGSYPMTSCGHRPVLSGLGRQSGMGVGKRMVISTVHILSP